MKQKLLICLSLVLVLMLSIGVKTAVKRITARNSDLEAPQSDADESDSKLTTTYPQPAPEAPAQEPVAIPMESVPDISQFSYVLAVITQEHDDLVDDYDRYRLVFGIRTEMSPWQLSDLKVKYKSTGENVADNAYLEFEPGGVQVQTHTCNNTMCGVTQTIVVIDSYDEIKLNDLSVSATVQLADELNSTERETHQVVLEENAAPDALMSGLDTLMPQSLIKLGSDYYIVHNADMGIDSEFVSCSLLFERLTGDRTDYSEFRSLLNTDTATVSYTGGYPNTSVDTPTFDDSIVTFLRLQQTNMLEYGIYYTELEPEFALERLAASISHFEFEAGSFSFTQA